MQLLLYFGETIYYSPRQENTYLTTTRFILSIIIIIF